MELLDSTIVRCRLDNGEWLLCEKKEELDVNVARVRSWNQLKIYPTRFNRRNPFSEGNFLLKSGDYNYLKSAAKVFI